MLSYDMSVHGEDPLYVHLCKCIRADIKTGAIAPHEKLPSKRSLARNLDVAVITVEAAYAQLIAEGYLYAEARRGYFACELQRTKEAAVEDEPRPLPCGTCPAPAVSPAEARRAAAARPWMRDKDTRPIAAKTARPRFDLSPNAISADAFPLPLLTKALRDTLSLEPAETLIGAGDARGEDRLRRAIAQHLRRTRGFAVDPDLIIVGAGSQVLYNLIVQLLERPACVAVENPGYSRPTRVYEANGIPVERIPIDENGIDVDALRAIDPPLVHTVPTHHFPTGTDMPASRRYELLAWANEAPGRYIVEDDYDGEFRLAGKPLPTLASIDEDERVIYVNTFSRALGPAFRIAYLVLPRHLRDAFADKLGFYSCTLSAIDQLALARFVEHGDFERFINRTKTRCRAARDALIDALAKTPAARHISFENIDSGLHAILRIEAKSPEPQERNPAPRSEWRRPGMQADRAAHRTRETAPDGSYADARTRLEHALVQSLARQDVAVAALSDFGDAPMPGADEKPTDTGRVSCRLVIGLAALHETRAKAAAEALWRGIAPFI